MNCNFTSCSNSEYTDESGGAISYSVFNGNLIVTSCYFYKCIAYCQEGGGIDARTADYVMVSFSTFLECVAHAPPLASGGGGINLFNIQQHPYIRFCSFISCATDDDGGGMSISQTAPANILLCAGCRFINGQSEQQENEYNWAGGLMLWDNYKALICTDSLFTSNKATYGGAYGTNYNVAFLDYPLRFCFFHKNKAMNGNDVAFRVVAPTNDTIFFLHCCSTSDSKRVGYKENDIWYTADFNWLPLGTLSCLNTWDGNNDPKQN